MGLLFLAISFFFSFFSLSVTNELINKYLSYIENDAISGDESSYVKGNISFLLLFFLCLCLFLYMYSILFYRLLNTSFVLFLSQLSTKLLHLLFHTFYLFLFYCFLHRCIKYKQKLLIFLLKIFVSSISHERPYTRTA